jgi:dTDP-4-dehydrorhamnose reductase
VRKINVEGPRNLAQGCARFGCKFVHISCGNIFDGTKEMPQPYFEDDTPQPLSFYGKCKLESETAVRGNSPNYILVRSAWLYGTGGKNYIKSILAQTVGRKRKTVMIPDDQFGAPTWVSRLALQIKELTEKGGRGTYHASANGYCSRFEYAKHVLETLHVKANMEPVHLADLDDQEGRPANCLLENRLAKKQGLHVMRHWKEDLDQFLEQNGKALLKEARARKA